MNGFTKVDNWLWDYVMPKAKPNTFKIVSAVMRMTAGWQQDTAVMTFDDFHRLTGIDNRGTLSSAITDAMASGFIERQETGRSFAYSLKIVPLDYPQQSKNRTDNSPKIALLDEGLQSENRTVDSLKIVPSSYNIKKEEKESEPTPSPIKTLAAAFVEKTGIFASLAAWASDWELPLATILQHSGGDMDTAVSKIEAAVDLARQRGYTIKSPMSLTTIVANMNGTNGSHSGVLKVSSR